MISLFQLLKFMKLLNFKYNAWSNKDINFEKQSLCYIYKVKTNKAYLEDQVN